MNLRDDLYWLALTVWQEARGESTNGQLAVAWVIMNRVRDKGTSVLVEVLRPLAFSCWNGNSPTRRALAEAEDAASWLGSFRVSCAAYFNLTPDPTKGANHYLVSTLTPKPSWFDTERITVTIGNHTFLRLP